MEPMGNHGEEPSKTIDITARAQRRLAAAFGGRRCRAPDVALRNLAPVCELDYFVGAGGLDFL